MEQMLQPISLHRAEPGIPGYDSAPGGTPIYKLYRYASGVSIVFKVLSPYIGYCDPWVPLNCIS